MVVKPRSRTKSRSARIKDSEKKLKKIHEEVTVIWRNAPNQAEKMVLLDILSGLDHAMSAIKSHKEISN